MASNKKENLNYLHICKSQKVEIARYKNSIFNAAIPLEDKLAIVDFYIFNAPILKNGVASNGFNKSLKDYEWGTQKNNAASLERALLKNSTLQSFVFIKSNSISNTLETMDLKDRICIEHERAVLKLEGKAEIDEAGIFHFSESETRMESFFRHIRNSLAHNRTYVFGNNFILLEDCDENKNITARLLIKINTLLNWIKVITSKNDCR